MNESVWKIMLIPENRLIFRTSAQPEGGGAQRVPESGHEVLKSPRAISDGNPNESDSAARLVDNAALRLDEMRVQKEYHLGESLRILETTHIAEALRGTTRVLQQRITAFMAIADKDQTVLDTLDPKVVQAVHDALQDHTITPRETAAVMALQDMLREGGILHNKMLRETAEKKKAEAWKGPQLVQGKRIDSVETALLNGVDAMVKDLMHALNDAETLFAGLDLQYSGELFGKLRRAIPESMDSQGIPTANNLGYSIKQISSFANKISIAKDQFADGRLLDAGETCLDIASDIPAFALHLLNVTRHLAAGIFDLATRLVDDLVALFLAEKGIGGRKESGWIIQAVDFAQKKTETGIGIIDVPAATAFDLVRVGAAATQGVLNGITEFARCSVNLALLPEKVISDLVEQMSSLIHGFDGIGDLISETAADPKKITYALGYLSAIAALGVMGGAAVLAHKMPGILGKLAKLLELPDKILLKLEGVAAQMGSTFYLSHKATSHVLLRSYDAGSVAHGTGHMPEH